MYPVGTREREGETRNGGDDHCSLQFIVSLFIAILDLTACNIMDVSQQILITAAAKNCSGRQDGECGRTLALELDLDLSPTSVITSCLALGN